jgi:hypothetical protein
VEVRWDLGDGTEDGSVIKGSSSAVLRHHGEVFERNATGAGKETERISESIATASLSWSEMGRARYTE